MKISYNWLKEYCDIPVSPKELAEKLTMLGLEIESIHEPGKNIDNVVVGKILEINPHPQADKLVVCKTDIGKGEPLQIICGAKNMKVGDKVPTALDGATLPGGIKITRRKMRGVESFGMMCSPAELGVADDAEGLMILDPSTPIGLDIREVLGLNDVIFEIEITPNRGDWASYIGLAREICAYYNLPLKIPSFQFFEDDEEAISISNVTIECPELCPRYAGRVIKGVKVAPSPEWLERKLVSAGQRPINNVVDITNFVLLECGHPLHAFDLNKLNEKRIVVRLARLGETIRTLYGEIRELKPDQMVIADGQIPQALAGIMGGADSEVDNNTIDVFLESAYFNPVSIRRTAKAHSLLTEAAQHFQRGADPNIVIWAINRATSLIQRIAGGRVLKGVIDVYPVKMESKIVKLRYERTKKRLGVDVEKQYQKSILTNLGFSIKRETNTEVEVQVPSWRHDVSLEEDLIEEIARFYGYDRIPHTLPKVRQTEVTFDTTFKKLHNIRSFLVNKGLTECFSWTFSNPEIVEELGFPESFLKMVEIQNPLSKNLRTMRTSIIPNILSIAQKNHLEDRLAIFEIGPVFLPNPTDILPDEPQRLCLLLMGYAQPRLWCYQDRKFFDFFDLKGLCEELLDEISVSYKIEKTDFPILHKGQSLKLVVKNEIAGYLGKLNPKISHKLEISENTFIAELYLDKLLASTPKRKIYKEVSEYPSTSRDLAILVDETVDYADIITSLKPIGERVLRKIDVFDVYKGSQVPKGKKSIALSFNFCSNEKTLTDEEINSLMETIINTLTKKFNAQIR
ncbi:MAG: phenylalanine--tRNA ligase subunit beta [Candidatus Hydrogenedentes bacterium]|nr:phenylalanine--tRNA ligase subunit beta [Candidatus Hydrogenedentota bacterium]